MWKHVIAVLAMLLAFGYSAAMLRSVLGNSSPWLALMVFMCFLGLARAAEPLCRLKVPHALRRLRNWELRGGVYRKLAVPGFGKWLRKAPLRYLNATVYLSRSPSDPRAIRLQIESAEAIHFWAAVLLLPYMMFCGLRSQWAVVDAFLLVQILGNVYPIMHLRYVRGRLDGAMHRAMARRQSNT